MLADHRRGRRGPPVRDALAAALTQFDAAADHLALEPGSARGAARARSASTPSTSR